MDKELSLVEHLNELRGRIIISLAALLIGGIASFPAASFILEYLRLPAEGLIDTLVFFSPQEAFLIHFRIAFLAGLVISMPVILYEVWAFVSPAVDGRIKRRGGIFITASFSAFAL